jgi:hypothetical protein
MHTWVRIFISEKFLEPYLTPKEILQEGTAVVLSHVYVCLILLLLLLLLVVVGVVVVAVVVFLLLFCFYFCCFCCCRR